MTSVLRFLHFSSRTSWTSRQGEMSCAGAHTPGADAPATFAARLSGLGTAGASP